MKIPTRASYAGPSGIAILFSRALGQSSVMPTDGFCSYAAVTMAIGVMPAGSLELGESIIECLKREVREESGLEVVTATLIAVYSGPRFAFTNAYGGEHQMLSLIFRIDEWAGELATTTDETTDARFFAFDGRPVLPPLYEETLRDLATYDGRVILK